MTYAKVRGPDSSGGVVRGWVLVPLAFADDLPGVLHGWSAAEPGWHRPGCPVSPFQRCGGDGVGHRQLGRAWERWMPGVVSTAPAGALSQRGLAGYPPVRPRAVAAHDHLLTRVVHEPCSTSPVKLPTASHRGEPRCGTTGNAAAERVGPRLPAW
jgi:hypothetical protein